MLTKPKHIISLSTACILAGVECKVWTATAQNKKEAERVAEANKADHDVVYVGEKLLAGLPSHKGLLNYRQKVYNWHQRMTYEWAGSLGLLPSVRIPDYMSGYQEHEKNWRQLEDQFFNDYDSEIGKQAFKRGDLFDRSRYPDKQELKYKFGIRLITSDVPTGDFRNQISQDLADDLYHNFEKQATNTVNEIINKQSSQLVKVMESLSACCETHLDQDGKVRRKKLYDSTFNLAVELCQTFKTFNLTANPDLEDARRSLESLLAGISLEALRESDGMRAQVKTEIDDILGRFKPKTII